MLKVNYKSKKFIFGMAAGLLVAGIFDQEAHSIVNIAQKAIIEIATIAGSLMHVLINIADAVTDFLLLVAQTIASFFENNGSSPSRSYG